MRLDSAGSREESKNVLERVASQGTVFIFNL